jgi:hypothetical protein
MVTLLVLSVSVTPDRLSIVTQPPFLILKLRCLTVTLLVLSRIPQYPADLPRRALRPILVHQEGNSRILTGRVDCARRRSRVKSVQDFGNLIRLEDCPSSESSGITMTL